MSSRFLIAIALTLWSAGTLFLPGKAHANTPLNSATVEAVRQLVEVNLKNQGFRRAKAKQDTLVPKDALKTGQASMAELRFNDRSLARIGERALFEFQPGSREIRLNQGTVLLLIQPKQGTTRVRTPNAAAGIRGSALFVRFIPANPNTGLGPMTIVGALTNSDIKVSNQDGSQEYVLRAGEVAVVHHKNIGIYTFDLNSFYATSPLAKGLDLDQPVGSKSNLDQTIADVRQETLDALKTLPVGKTPNPQQLAANPAWMLMSPPTAQAPQSTETASNSSNPLPANLNRVVPGISSMNTAAEVLRGLGESLGGSRPATPGSLPPASGVVPLPLVPSGGVVTTAPPATPTLPGSAAAPTPQDIPRPTPNQPPTPITPPVAAGPAPTVPTPQPPVVVTPPVTPPPAAGPAPTIPTPQPPVVVTPPPAAGPAPTVPTPQPPVVVTPPVTPPVEPTVPRPTPVTPAIPAVPNPGAGPATPATPASPANPPVNANVTVSPPAVDLSPVQPAAPATP